MPIESVADRRSLLTDDGDVAVLATIWRGEALIEGETPLQAERPIVGLFDRGYDEAGDAAGYRPRFLVLDEDAVNLAKDHRLLLVGHVWSVRTPQPDGEGFTQLPLRHVGPYLPARAFPFYDAEYPVEYGLAEGSENPLFDPANPRLRYPFTLSGVLEEGVDFLTPF